MKTAKTLTKCPYITTVFHTTKPVQKHLSNDSWEYSEIVKKNK